MGASDRRDAADRVRSAHGPLALEELLRADVIADRDRVRIDPRLLAAPLVIVVPSRSLRLHVARKLVEWTGGACAGVEVLTLAGLARQVLVSAGESPPRGALLFETLVSEALAENEELRGELSAFDDAERALAATVRDLFDAGFEAAHASALSEALHDPSAAMIGTAVELRRATSIIRIASAVWKSSQSLQIDVAAGGFRRAAHPLAGEGYGTAWRGVWVVGFSDATGSALDFLEPLLRRENGRIYSDNLADGAFGAPFRSRLCIPTPTKSTEAVRPSVKLGRAPSVDAEVRAAVNRVRVDIDRGVLPEHIAIVTRDLAPYRVALRRHLGRLSIPFSVVGAAGSRGPAERRLRALAELFESGGECELGRWIDARGREAATIGNEGILTAGLRALGVADLDSLAALDLAQRMGDRDALRLPLRAASNSFEVAEQEHDEPEGETEDEPDDTGGEFQAPSTISKLVPIQVPRSELEAELDHARRALAFLEDWMPKAMIRDHVERVQLFVARILSWGEPTFGRVQLEAALLEIVTDTPFDMQLSRSSFFALLAQALANGCVTPLGGSGGGISVLDVTEARGRTFAIVHVLGLARGRFPRQVREDPLLSDTLRGRLSAVLPDLPRKGTGRDEERVLFEALVRSAPDVHLSWLTLDDEGKVLLPSALLEHVLDPSEIECAPIEYEPLSERSTAWEVIRPAHEHLVVAALKDRRSAFDELIPLVVEEARSLCGLDPAPSLKIARGRSAVLAEYEPAYADRARLGPYFGFIGVADRPEDLRAKDLYVSHLEALAGCGWQAFLKYVLRLEPPFDPAANLPDLEPRLVGDVVHAVLKRVIDERAERVTWPAREALERLLFAEARAALRERGVLLPGFEALIVARVRPLVDVARKLDEREGMAPVSKAEIVGAIPIPEGLLAERELAFRADRLDELVAGKRYTDFKTGKPKSQSEETAKQRESHLKEIAGGRKLQAIVYARHAGENGEGRYVFLDEHLTDERRVLALRHDDPAANDALDNTLEVLLGAWDLGAFTPRMLGANFASDGELCARCELKIACLRGDSTAHRRLADFVRAEAAGSTPADDAVRALWNLGRPAKPAPENPTGATKPAAKKRGKAKS